MYAACLALTFMAASSASAAEGDDPFHPSFLVQAKAERVEYVKKGAWQEVTFRIQHVYTGDAKLEGKTFHQKVSLWLGGLTTSPAYELVPPVKKGEVGIWQLDYTDDGKIITNNYYMGRHFEDPQLVSVLSIPVPARRILGSSSIYYPSAVQWARLVETVYKAKPTDRTAILKQHVISANPYITAWSLRTLAAYKPAGLIPFLEKLVDDPRLSVAGQVTIDAILSRIHWKEWLGSMQRAALFQRWISAENMERRDVLMIVSRFQGALDSRTGVEDNLVYELDWDTWLPVMEKWVVQKFLSPDIEDRLFNIYYSVNRFHRKPIRDRIVLHAINLLKASKDEETQAYAARWLGIVDLDEKELATIKEFQAKSSSLRIHNLLQSAIQHSTPRPRP